MWEGCKNDSWARKTKATSVVLPPNTIHPALSSSAIVPAAPTYSFLRTAVLSLTPGDLKCRLYCNGSACKFCNLFDGPSVVPGLYSTWITDDILAMARPQPFHFENDIIICQFKESNIVAVFNLEELGEHAYCGKGNLISGFSYDPERFMKNNIFHYNFPLPDFEACIAEHMADIATVMAHELSKGKIAVHCHAGHGRTGTAIAACLMRTRGLTPRQAVEIVRSKRPSSVQSSEQVRALHSLHHYLGNTTPILPAQPFASTSQYVEYTSRILPKMDMRQYGNVPKPLFVGTIALLHKCFISVNFRLERTSNQLKRFRFECDGATSLEVTEEMLNLMSVGVTQRGQSWYAKRVGQGMNILNIERFLEDDADFIDLVSFIDYFINTAFFQLTTAAELKSFLIRKEGEVQDSIPDWSWSLCLMLSAICLLPQQLHKHLSILVVKWFARSTCDAGTTVLRCLKENRNK